MFVKRDRNGNTVLDSNLKDRRFINSDRRDFDFVGKTHSFFFAIQKGSLTHSLLEILPKNAFWS